MGKVVSRGSGLVCLLSAMMVGLLAAGAAQGQSFRVQCPTSTITHPDPLGTGANNAENTYSGPTAVPFMAITNISEAGTTVTVTATGGGAFPGLVSGLHVGIMNVTSTSATHPGGFNGVFPINAVLSNTETAGVTTARFTYTATTTGLGSATSGVVTSNVDGGKNGAIKCQQISGGDGYAVMADGTQTFMFSFGPLSGLADIAKGLPGTEFPNVFNTVYPGNFVPGDPAVTDGANTITAYDPGSPSFTFNGAVGLIGDQAVLDGQSGGATAVANIVGGLVDSVTITNPGTNCTGADPSGGIYTGPPNVTIAAPTAAGGIQAQAAATVTNGCITGITVNYTGFNYTGATAAVTIGPAYNKCQPPPGLPPQYANAPLPADCLTGHVDPRQIMDVGVMNGNIPAPLIAFDEDDEMFLTLTNVGMIMRPDLFEQHTVHFHGYPNASSFYDGVPDASVAINIGASFTYYYLAPDAGTYFWHCHITPPEHLQMGMVGQLYVRPRQDRLAPNADLYTALQEQNGVAPGQKAVDLRTACNPAADILCSAYTPAVNTNAKQGTDLLGNPQKYVYNDGDGSTAYDVEYPLQMHGFDPNFHFVGMTFNPEAFVDMKDKYFLLNGRSYPDTVTAGPQVVTSSDGKPHYSQPLPSIINIPVGGKAALRLVNLSVSEYHTIQTLGVPMKVVGWNAKLLRDQAGNNTEYYSNSITLGGGESADVILDASDTSLFKAGSVFYLYTPNLDHLSNDAENFGGLMTAVHICKSVAGGSTFGNTCMN